MGNLFILHQHRKYINLNNIIMVEVMERQNYLQRNFLIIKLSNNRRCGGNTQLLNDQSRQLGTLRGLLGLPRPANRYAAAYEGLETPRFAPSAPLTVSQDPH